MGDDAKRLKESSAYQVVLESMHMETYANFMATQAGEEDKRFSLWALVQAVGELDRKLDILQDNAKLARAELKAEEKNG